MEIWNAERAHKLDNEQRRKALPPDETLLKLGLKKGMNFADIGCGIGYFTLPAARIAGENAKVYALDVSEEMLSILTGKSNTEELENIEVIQTAEYDLKLPNGAADFAFICNVLHEQNDRERFLAEAARILVTGGTLAVIEWKYVQGERGPMLTERISFTDMAALLVRCGFTGLQEREMGAELYAVTAMKL